MSKFGTFLIERGLATPEQVLDALNRQKALQRPLGAIAVEKKMLTTEQVFHTLNHQMQTRKRFGETVLELGTGQLTDRDINRLLDIQQEERPAVGTLLVEMGVMDFEVMTDALNLFLSQTKQGMAD